MSDYPTGALAADDGNGSPAAFRRFGRLIPKDPKSERLWPSHQNPGAGTARCGRDRAVRNMKMMKASDSFLPYGESARKLRSGEKFSILRTDCSKSDITTTNTMCSFAQQNDQQRGNMCWCFEEISLMILVQRILMYLWYRLLLKMFPRLSVLPSCHECSPRRSLPCGQLADEYWKASYFSRTLHQNLQQPTFGTVGFCAKHIATEAAVMPCNAIAPFESFEEEEDDGDRFNFNCSDISHIYQSTFLDDYDECFLAKDIAWDAPVPESMKKAAVLPAEGEISLLLNDYYIDDDLDDHLHVAEYQTAIGNSLFCESWID
uniref:Uncharacterized protein n=1 Tax=Anopheles farauti TaxID=69004 RepID=A0A182QQX8_9DIPT